MFRKVSYILLLTFGLMAVTPPNGWAQAAPVFGETGFKPVSTELSFPVFKGIKIYPQEPFRFDFLVDTPAVSLRGEAEAISDKINSDGIASSPSAPRNDTESLKLVKYFMAALTVPEGDLWVNLNPDEPDRIVPEALGQTEMGRDLLAQDYVLKQLTASLMSPENEEGKKFWEKIYAAAGQTDIPIETFNKVWIIPDKAEVYQNGDVAYIVNAKLKVMMEGDYLGNGERGMVDKNKSSTTHQSPTTDIKSTIRQTILPLIETEVNNSPSFAPLRQIYHSMILAKWYEQHFKNSVLGQSYVDRNTVEGIKLSSPNASVGDPFLKDISAKDNGFPTKALGNDNSVQDIYNQYLTAYKQGAYDLIKEDYDPVTQEVVTRKYFSGGVVLATDSGQLAVSTSEDFSRKIPSENMAMLQVDLAAATQYGTNNKIVLVVDDTPGDLRLAQIHFEELGYQVLEAKNLEEAKAQIEGNLKIDFIYSDKDFPNTNSAFELLDFISDDQKFPNLYMVIVTAAQPSYFSDKVVGRLKFIYEKSNDLDVTCDNIDRAVRLMASLEVTSAATLPSPAGDAAMMGVLQEAPMIAEKYFGSMTTVPDYFVMALDSSDTVREGGSRSIADPEMEFLKTYLSDPKNILFINTGDRFKETEQVYQPLLQYQSRDRQIIFVTDIDSHLYLGQKNGTFQTVPGYEPEPWPRDIRKQYMTTMLEMLFDGLKTEEWFQKEHPDLFAKLDAFRSRRLADLQKAFDAHTSSDLFKFYIFKDSEFDSLGEVLIFDVGTKVTIELRGLLKGKDTNLSHRISDGFKKIHSSGESGYFAAAGDYFLDVTQSNKGHAALKVLQQCVFPMIPNGAKVMTLFMGDSLNDLPMLQLKPAQVQEASGGHHEIAVVSFFLNKKPAYAPKLDGEGGIMIAGQQMEGSRKVFAWVRELMNVKDQSVALIPNLSVFQWPSQNGKYNEAMMGEDSTAKSKESRYQNRIHLVVSILSLGYVAIMWFRWDIEATNYLTKFLFWHYGDLLAPAAYFVFSQVILRVVFKINLNANRDILRIAFLGIFTFLALMELAQLLPGSTETFDIWDIPVHLIGSMAAYSIYVRKYSNISRHDSAMMNPAKQTPGGIDLNSLNVSTQGTVTPMQAPPDRVMLLQNLSVLDVWIYGISLTGMILNFLIHKKIMANRILDDRKWRDMKVFVVTLYLFWGLFLGNVLSNLMGAQTYLWSVLGVRLPVLAAVAWFYVKEINQRKKAIKEATKKFMENHSIGFLGIFNMPFKSNNDGTGFSDNAMMAEEEKEGKEGKEGKKETNWDYVDPLLQGPYVNAVKAILEGYLSSSLSGNVQVYIHWITQWIVVKYSGSQVARFEHLVNGFQSPRGGKVVMMGPFIPVGTAEDGWVFFFFSALEDKAMMSREEINGTERTAEEFPYAFYDQKSENNAMLEAPGGIDLNALDISTQGQATPMQAPLDPAMPQKPLNLTPRIIHIGAVNVYDFLGLNRPADGGPDDANSLMPDTELLAVKEDS